MGYVTRHRISATVTASGNATQSYLTDSVVNGELLAVLIGKNGTSTIATGANVLITGADTSHVLLNVTSTNSSNTVVSFYPRGLAQSNAGALLGGTTGAGAVVGVPVPLPIAERIRVQFSSAGTASAGGLRATVDLYIG